jgi:putative two-component system hydrogenase maturation factor HypX/HoxX
MKANMEFSRIRSELIQETAFVYFDFYNGAMSAEHCNALQKKIASLHATGMKRLVLMGGSDFWSNGLHLTRIEHSNSPADASQQNIEAMDDLCEMLIRLDDVQVCSVLRGNSGAGGVFLALAADVVLVQSHVVLNPHYKSMGNLYGSEFWTYLLPKRLSDSRIKWLMNHRLPLGAEEAMRIGLVDDVLPTRTPSIEQEVLEWLEMHTGNDFFETKKRQRSEDERTKPLRAYREEELAQMKLNFYGFDPSYHVARYHFVHKTPKSRTPLYLAKHRRLTRPKNHSAVLS